jgi:hypothetical protein
MTLLVYLSGLGPADPVSQHVRLLRSLSLAVASII